MDFRFNAHDPQSGAFLYALPRPAKAQIGDVFGERGTLELTYSTKQARALDLPTFVEVRAQVQYEGGEWADVGPALIRLGGSHEDTDAAGMRTVTFVGREWLLGRARVSAGDVSTELIDGKRPFYQATAGEIMRTLLLEAKDRGAAAGIDLGGFTATQDSAGNPWGERVTIYYSPGLPIGDVLQNLVDQGLCDYRMNGRSLEMFVPETTLGRDLTTGTNPVRVHGAVTEAPVSYTLEDLANSALLIGEDGFQVEVDNPSAPNDYGRLEVTIEQGGVNQEGTARTLIDAELQRGSREIREITRTQHAAGARALPYRDYRCGDFVQVHDQGEWQRYRVREIQLVRDADGWTIHTVLNDRLQELLLRLAKKQNGIVNGSRGSGGDGTRPAPVPKPGVEPAAPQGLVIDQQVYLDDAGTARGVITAGWGEVTQSTRGLAIDIGGYELWWRENATFAVWQRATATSGDTEVSHSPVVLTAGDGTPMEYQWRVRAIAQESNRPGPWSSIVTLTMTQDTTPPPPPSAPVVETGFRIVTVAWDGLDQDGLPMPRDFAWTRIYLAATESMADARRVGSLGHPGSWNSDTMPADVPVWVALTAVDRVGNESAMTAAVSVTPRQLVDDEAIRDELTRIEDDYQDAIADLQQDIENIVIDEQGATTYWLPTAPGAHTDPPPKRGDLWFDTSDGNRLHRHDGQGWVSAADERVQTIQDAMDDFESDLNTVRDTADGKNRTFFQSTMPATPPARAGDLWFNTANGYRLHRNNGATFIEVADGRIAEVEDAVENIDISGPLSEARAEWLADAAADAQTKAQNAAATAEAAAKAYADAVATGAVEGELEGLQDYADNAAEQARQAAIQAAIAEARVIANEARDEALAAALDADAIISQSIAQFESDLDLVRESADGKSRIVWSPNAPSGEGKAGDTWFRTSSNRIIGHWRHSGSAWVSMSLDATVIPNLDAGKITSGFIDSERIAAASIRADQLLVGNLTNLIPDPRGRHDITDTWTSLRGSIGGPGSFWRHATPSGGQRGVRAGADGEFGQTCWLVSDTFQVSPGERYAVQVKAYVRDLVGADPLLNFRLVNADGGFAGDTPWISLEQGAGAWITHSAIIEIPDDYAVVGAQLRYTIPSSATSGYAYFVEPVVRPSVGAVMIEDGAITAPKIQAGAVGATAIAAESIDASKIVAGGIQADSLIVPGTVGSTLIRDGAITTSKIEAGAITAQSGIIASLDAGVISSGFIDSARIRAGSIAADKIMIGNTTNLVPDPGGLGDIRDSWTPHGPGSIGGPGNGTAFWRYGTTSQGYRGVRVGNPSEFGQAQWLVSSKFQVKPGESYLIEVIGYRSELVGGFPRMGIRLGDIDDAFMGETETVTMDQGGFTTYRKIVTIPNDLTIKYGRLRYTIPSSVTSGYAFFFSPVVRPAVGATLIEDGAITTEKIATGAITAESGIIGSLSAGVITTGQMSGERISAGTLDAGRVIVGDTITGTLIQEGAITTDHITANAITSGKIAALAIEAGHLQANAVEADTIAAGAIDGMMITGATIRTAASGSRVQMNTQGLYAYNPSNVETFSINGNTGAVNITGNLTQANSYGDLRIGPEIFYDSQDGTASPAISFRRAGTTYYGPAGIVLHGTGADQTLTMQGVISTSGYGSSISLPVRNSDRDLLVARGFGPGKSARMFLSAAGGAVLRGSGDSYFQSTASNDIHAEAAGGSVYLRSKLNASADYSRAHITLSDTGSITLRTQQTDNSNVRGGYINLNTDGAGVYAGAGASGVAARNLWLRAYGNAYLAAFSTGANASAQAYVDLLASGTTYWQGSRMYISTLPASSGAVPIGRVSGQLHSVSSSRKYKLLEEPIDARDSNLEDKLLSIPVKTWVDRTAAERLAAHHTAVHNGEDPEDDLVGCGTLERFPGVVAEDLHDAGLNMFVGYEDGEPEWVLYDRIGPALIPIIKRLRDRVDALETQIGATS